MLREGGGEMTLWSLVAKEHVADGIACLAARKPDVEDGWHIGILPLEHHRTTIGQEQNHRLARLDKSLKKVMLRSLHSDVAHRSCLACHLLCLTEYCHNYIGPACSGKSLIEQLLVTARRWLVVPEETLFENRIVRIVAAFGIAHLSLTSKTLLHHLEDGAVLSVVGRHAPAATQLALVVGHWTDESNLSLFGKRQQVVVVLEEHESIGCDLTCSFTVLCLEEFGLASFGIVVAIWVIEKTKAVFGLEHTTASIVDLLLCYTLLVEQFLKLGDVEFRAHIHIDSCIESSFGHHIVATESVSLHLAYCTIVGHDESVEVPLVAQHVVLQPSVGCSWSAVNVVERSHHTAHTSFDTHLIRQQILVEHTVFAHIGSVVVAT